MEFVILFGWPFAFFVAVPAVADVHYGFQFVFVAAVVFTWALDVVKQLLQLVAWLYIRPGNGESKAENKRRDEQYKRVVDFLYVYLFIYHRHQYAALLIIMLHTFTCIILIFIEKVGGFHSWFMLNGNLRGGFLRPLIGGGFRQPNLVQPGAAHTPGGQGPMQQRQVPGGGWWRSFRLLGQNQPPVQHPATGPLMGGAELQTQQPQQRVETGMLNQTG